MTARLSSLRGPTLDRSGLVRSTASQPITTPHKPSLRELKRSPGRPGQLPTRASHRSGRARLTHPAPQCEGLLRAVYAVNHLNWRERIPLRDASKAIPSPARASATPSEPLAPNPLDLMAEALQGITVSGESEISVMPAELRTENPVLFAYRRVPVATAPSTDPAQASGQTCLGSPSLQDPASLARSPPVQGEAQKVEADTRPVLLPIRRLVKLDQARLLWV